MSIAASQLLFCAKMKKSKKGNRSVFVEDKMIFHVGRESLYWSLIGQIRPTLHSKVKTRHCLTFVFRPILPVRIIQNPPSHERQFVIGLVDAEI